MITSTKPLYDNIVIEIEQPASKTPGGIILIEKAQKPTYKGKVVAVGHRITDISVGEYILHKKFIGIDFLMNDKMHKFIKREDIIAIL